ncbi:MAG: hypothetical protein ACREJ0_20730, partial [Geminicoccaceae bacterium]
MDGQRPGAFQPALVEALSRAGLELQETVGDGGDAEYLISGNTFANRELLKRCGGRWSQQRQRWV